MNNKEALKKAVDILKPFSGEPWDFDSNLAHLNTLTKHIPEGSLIFDAGCGTGTLILALSFLGYKTKGGDKYIFDKDSAYGQTDLDGLQQVWNKYGLQIREFDVLKDSFSEKYDAVISIATLEHQDRPKLFLNRLKEMTKDGGYLYLATPNPSHLLNRIRFLFGRPAQSNLKEFFREENFIGHLREYTLTELKQMLTWSGFAVIEAKNRQELKPKIGLKSGRDLYVNFLRAVAYLMPGARDANIILAKK